MEYTSKRKKGFRIGLRILGLVFMLGASYYLYNVFSKGTVGAFRMLTVIVAIMFLLVGFSYVKQSFGITAYDVTYRILPEHLELVSEKKNITIPYDKITKVDLTKPKEDMDYYMVHILAERYNLMMHVEGEGKLAEQMYQKLLEYTDANEEE